MFLIGFPLLVLPFAAYNLVAFLLPSVEWKSEVARARMPSGTDWVLTAGDLLIAVAIFILFVEMLKTRRLIGRTVTDHILSIILLVVIGAEFLEVDKAATGTFFLLVVVSFVDVVGGFTARRHVGSSAQVGA